jgi:hypothetical protein
MAMKSMPQNVIDTATCAIFTRSMDTSQQPMVHSELRVKKYHRYLSNGSTYGLLIGSVLRFPVGVKKAALAKDER